MNLDEIAAGPPVAVEEERIRALDAIQQSLERMERAPPAVVAATVLRSLERIARHARATAPFYQKRLDPVFEDDHFTPEHWPEIPILTRETVRAHTDDVHARFVPAGTAIRTGETSGSSGTPLQFSWNTLTSVSTRAVVERMIAWHGLDPMATVAEIKSFPDGDADWPGRRMPRSWSFRGRGIASYYRLVVTTPIDKQLDWLQMIGPSYLLTYPTLARELARTALRQERNLHIDAILTVGEVLTEEIRDAVRDAFGAKIIDSYGCQEAGKIAIECEVSGHYHVCTSSVLLEIIDDEGRQVPPGGEGRIVLTSLYNYAMPFIRYEVGDYARLGDGPCPCGRSLPVLTRIFGRKRNMLLLPDGNRMWLPGRVLAEFARHVPLQQMRLVQKSPEHFELLYVPRLGATSVDHPGLEAAAKRSIHPSVSIAAVAVEELPRSAGGKYEDVVGLG